MVNCFIDPTSLTRDNFQIKKLLEDNKSIRYLGVRLARDLFLALERTKTFLTRFRHPILIQHSRMDKIISYRSSESAFKTVGSPDKEIRLYTESYHELFTDLDKDQIISDTLQWTHSRLSNAEPLGKLPALKTGIKSSDFNSKLSLLASYGKIFMVIGYLIILRRLNKNPAYQRSKLKLLFFPVFWTYKYWEILTKAGISQIESFLNQILVEFHLF
jgi:Serine aminopeptidase, S33